MFGNRLGWSLSLVIVGLIAMLIYFLHEWDRPQPPTSIGQNAAKYTLALPVDARSLAPFMVDETDAGDLYRKALLDYRKNEPLYNLAQYVRSRDNPNPKPMPRLEGVELVLSARTAKKAVIFGGDADPFSYRDIIKYNFFDNPTNDIKNLGSSILSFGLYQKSQGKTAEAQRSFEAVFALGVHLYEERITWREADAGQQLLGSAGAALMRMAEEAKDDARAQRLKEFTAGIKDVIGRLLNRSSVYGAIYNLNREHAGDMVALAKNATERTWRVEALLSLGRCKFTSRRGGDQRGAIRTLRAMSRDSSLDPYVQYAAKVAHELDLAGFNTITTIEQK